jgi:hypothetical protein
MFDTAILAVSGLYLSHNARSVVGRKSASYSPAIPSIHVRPGKRRTRMSTLQAEWNAGIPSGRTYAKSEARHDTNLQSQKSMTLGIGAKRTFADRRAERTSALQRPPTTGKGR